MTIHFATDDRTTDLTKSTAARKDVHQGKAGYGDITAPLTQQGFATPDGIKLEDAGRPQSATLQSETSDRLVPLLADTLDDPAGTQALPVDTNSRRAKIDAELEEYDDPSLMGRLACIDGKDGDRSNPFDRFDDLDSWDEFRRGYEAEQVAQA